ncbi:MAG: aminotransferase class I/II-fold pyridoxal phosphate-dependent enzyme [Myxococcales bacterium]|nr:MAG: aminotransferase class I/II-fold pyridoxal phosphate-dependent enzyme [Myxococcales bacterium]
MTRLANQHGAINLAQGFPDWEAPAFLRQAAIEAIGVGHDQYARSPGLPSLTEAIADDVRATTGRRPDPEHEVVVGCGATELIFAAVQALCDVGDEVVLFEPFYDSYRASVHLAGAIPRPVALRFPDFTFDPDELRRAFSPRTRMVIVNNPHNPGGRVWTRAELEAVAALCREHDVVCLADEVYARLVYEGEHVAIATLDGMAERTLTLSSLSKTFSATGWRVGWAWGPPALTAALRLAHQFVTFSAPTPLQHAAAVALRHAATSGYYAELRDGYRQRRDFLVSALTDAGFAVRPPAGAYFVCAGTDALGRGDDDVALCRWLTERVGVAAIPPSAFCERPEVGRGYVRFVFCKRDETLAAAAGRLRAIGLKDA